jgi:hypothetical protein
MPFELIGSANTFMCRYFAPYSFSDLHHSRSNFRHGIGGLVVQEFGPVMIFNDSFCKQALHLKPLARNAHAPGPRHPRSPSVPAFKRSATPRAGGRGRGLVKVKIGAVVGGREHFAVALHQPVKRLSPMFWRL